MTEFDYIVVSAGVAGSVLAARLGDDRSTPVDPHVRSKAFPDCGWRRVGHAMAPPEFVGYRAADLIAGRA